jgi:hypothetical protein
MTEINFAMMEKLIGMSARCQEQTGSIPVFQGVGAQGRN